MSDVVLGAVIGALISAAASGALFASTLIASTHQRRGEDRQRRVDAVLRALGDIALEASSPRILRPWSKSPTRLMLAVTELVGAMPRQDRPLVDFLWSTSERMGETTSIDERLKLAMSGIAAVRTWSGWKRAGRSFMTGALIADRQPSLFSSKRYDEALPRWVCPPRREHRHPAS